MGRMRDDPLLDGLRPNCPLNVVKAAKASLKEPTRPYTPSEASRSLFHVEQYQDRPPSAFTLPTSESLWDSTFHRESGRGHVISPYTLSHKAANTTSTSDISTPFIRSRPSSRESRRTSSLQSSTTIARLASLDTVDVDASRAMSRNTSMEKPAPLPAHHKPTAIRSPQPDSLLCQEIDIGQPKFNPETPVIQDHAFIKQTSISKRNKSRPPSASNHEVKPTSSWAFTNLEDEEDESFTSWCKEVEGVLQQLWACNSSSSANSPGANNISTMLQACSSLQALMDYGLEQTPSTQWLEQQVKRPVGMHGEKTAVHEAVSEQAMWLMQHPHNDVQFQACSLALKVTRNPHLLQLTTKVLYRLSKDTINDAMFQQLSLLEAVLKMVAQHSNLGHTQLVNRDVLLYSTGCLKNVSNDSANQRALAKLGAIKTLAKLLDQLSRQVQPKRKDHESVAQIAVQVTGILRNLAVSPTHTTQFQQSNSLPAMIRLAEVMPMQAEVVLNVWRILSKLSLNKDCQAILEKQLAFVPLMIQLLAQYSKQRAILLRLAFVLGTLTTSSESTRQQVAEVTDSLSTILGILQQYVFAGDQDTDAVQPGNGETGKMDKLMKAATREECLVKLLRLLANLAMHQELGTELAGNQVMVQCLLSLLDEYSWEQADELVLNCVCTITNLAFYHQVSNQLLMLPPESLLPPITELLLSDNEEAIVESARAYGNLSRQPLVRQYMCAHRVVEILCLLLDHSHTEVLYSVCGTLVNVASDDSCRGIVIRCGGLDRLIEVLRCYASHDSKDEMQILLINVACKALFNLCTEEESKGTPAPQLGGAKSTGIYGSLDLTQSEMLRPLLRGFMDAGAGGSVGRDTASVAQRLMRLVC